MPPFTGAPNLCTPFPAWADHALREMYGVFWPEAPPPLLPIDGWVGGFALIPCHGGQALGVAVSASIRLPVKWPSTRSDSEPVASVSSLRNAAVK